MSKEIKKRNYSVGPIALMLIVGSIFTAIGIALIVITISGLIEHGIGMIGAGIIGSIVFILAFMGFGITALVMGGRQIYRWVRENRTKKYGKESTAKIVDYKSASFSKSANTRIRYALILAYNDDGEDKVFTTDYLFDVNEFKYLKGLESVKIKIDGNFVTVCEPFTKDIYKVDSTYGIELEFYKQKPVTILLRLWVVFFFIAFAFLIASLVVWKDLVIVAIVIVFTIHFPFAIPLAVYLIKWIRRKK